MQVRRSDSTRLEALSDGVFAFAATLLVVSLEVPDSFDELLSDLSGFASFALGFAALVLLGPLCRGHGEWSERRRPAAVL